MEKLESRSLVLGSLQVSPLQPKSKPEGPGATRELTPKSGLKVQAVSGGQPPGFTPDQFRTDKEIYMGVSDIGDSNI